MKKQKNNVPNVSHGQDMLKPHVRLMFGSSNLGYGMVNQTVSTFLMFFGTAVLGISGSLMGILTFLIVLWDCITDPIMGYYSDITKNKLLGRRHLYILIGVFTTSIIILFLWSTPSVLFDGVTEMHSWIWLFTCIMIWQLTTTAYSTPLTALGIDLAGNAKERSSLEAIKTLFFLLGMVLPTVLMGVLAARYNHYDEDGVLTKAGSLFKEPYVELAYISGAVSVILGCLCFFGTYSHLPRLQQAQRMEEITGNAAEKKGILNVYKDFFKTLKKNNHRAVILGYSITLVASAILMGIGLHVFTYVFEVGDSMYFIMGGLFVFVIISVPVWLLAMRKFENSKVIKVGISICFVGMAMFALVFVVFMLGIMPQFFPDHGTNILVVILPCMAVVGFGVGSLFLLPEAMMGDVITYEKGETGVEKTAIYSSFLTLAYKFAQSLALLIVGVMLDVVGFKESAGDVVEQSYGTKWGLGLIAIIGISVSLFIGGRFYSKYNLTSKDLEKFERQLAASYIEDGDVMISLSRIKNLEVVAEARRRTTNNEDTGEIDLIDKYATHYAMFRDEKVLGSGRIYREYSNIIIDKVYTVPEEKDKGYRDILTRKLIDIAKEQAKTVQVMLQKKRDISQVKLKILYVCDYFLKFGFKKVGDCMEVLPNDIVMPSQCKDNH